jgi:hypothetical protein
MCGDRGGDVEEGREQLLVCRGEQWEEQVGVGTRREASSAFGIGKRLVPGPFVRGRGSGEDVIVELEVTKAPFEDVGDVVRRGGAKMCFEPVEGRTVSVRVGVRMCDRLEKECDQFALVVL